MKKYEISFDEDGNIKYKNHKIERFVDIGCSSLGSYVYCDYNIYFEEKFIIDFEKLQEALGYIDNIEM